MKNIDISKYTKYSLELIFSEADKSATESLLFISETSKRSLILFAIYISLFSFSFFKIVELDYSYFILFIGSVISGFILRKNLLPYSISPKGANVEKMMDDYFISFSKRDQDKERLSSLIESYKYVIDRNFYTSRLMVSRFKKSVKSIAITLIVFGSAFSVFRFIESF